MFVKYLTISNDRGINLRIKIALVSSLLFMPLLVVLYVASFLCRSFIFAYKNQMRRIGLEGISTDYLGWMDWMDSSPFWSLVYRLILSVWVGQRELGSLGIITTIGLWTFRQCSWFLKKKTNFSHAMEWQHTRCQQIKALKWQKEQPKLLLDWE